jgi:hypothetical protein
MKTSLNLKFKGERDYLQGPDILNETMLWLEQNHVPQKISKIDFSFHRMARNGLALHVEKKDSLGEPVAECSYLSGTEARHVYLYESGNPITERYPYDESLICKDFNINVAEKSGSLKTDLPFTDIEIWVSLTKALHQKTLPEIKGKWLFVRGRFPFYERSSRGTEKHLHIAANFQNRLTRTVLTSNADFSGEIFFSTI